MSTGSFNEERRDGTSMSQISNIWHRKDRNILFEAELKTGSREKRKFDEMFLLVYENVLSQSFSVSIIMIVVPAMRQEACGSVVESQYAPRPQCPLRIGWSPGRDADDIASRIENIDIAIRLL